MARQSPRKETLDEAMARRTGAASPKSAPTLWQKVAGGPLAARWSRQENPPIDSDKSGYYAAALASGTLDRETQNLVARCLVWCDFNYPSFDKTRFAWYKDAFQAFPDDERCAFFAAALCYLQPTTDPDFSILAYRTVLSPQWRASKYWKQFALTPHTLLLDLAALLVLQAPESAEPDVLETIEAALDSAPEEYTGRKDLIVFLSRVYQAQGRADEYAESAYRWVFNRVPENLENCHYLAKLYVDRGHPDNNACIVYTYMVRLADCRHDKEEANQWILRLAHAYIELDQINDNYLSTFERAEKIAPHDSAISTAYLYTLAYQYTASGTETIAATGFNEDEEVIAKLEDAVARETQLRPVFEENGFEWAVILRALTLAYGRQNRSDEIAQSLYARAIWTCPEDVGVWALHAGTLAERQDYSEGALPVYEKVIHSPSCDASIIMALAYTYIRLEAEKDRERRPKALLLWEDLYRKGVQWPEMIRALVDAYIAEDRVNDTAVSLWEQQIANNPRNGVLRLRLARELRLRGDLQASMRYFKEAAKLLPKEFEAQFETGLTLKDNYADYQGAIKLLQKAVRLPEGQTHLKAHFALAEALLFCDKRAEAKAIFQKIVDEIDPEHTPTLLHLAKLNLRYEERGVLLAEALYTQASTLSPHSPDAYRGMADLYREKGQSEEEEQALEKYLMLSEPDAKRYRQLADLYIRKGDFLRAEGALRQVIAMGQGDRTLYTLLGEVIMQSQQKAAA